MWSLTCDVPSCRLIQSAFVDMENMLALLTEQQEVRLQLVAKEEDILSLEFFLILSFNFIELNIFLHAVMILIV